MAHHLDPQDPREDVVKGGDSDGFERAKAEDDNPHGFGSPDVLPHKPDHGGFPHQHSSPPMPQFMKDAGQLAQSSHFGDKPDDDAPPNAHQEHFGSGGLMVGGGYPPFMGFSAGDLGKAAAHPGLGFPPPPASQAMHSTPPHLAHLQSVYDHNPSVLASTLESVADHLNHGGPPSLPKSSHLSGLCMPPHHPMYSHPHPHPHPHSHPHSHHHQHPHQHPHPHPALRLHKDAPPFDHKLLGSHDGQMAMALSFSKLQSYSHAAHGRADLGKLESLESHPNVSDLEGIRSGLPLMSSMPMPTNLYPPVPIMKPPPSIRHRYDGPSTIAAWTQADVLQWLDKIMLGNLKPIFQKHQISGDMLLDLGEEDLHREMGIHSGIIRRKLLSELRVLKSCTDMFVKREPAFCGADERLGPEARMGDVSDCDLSQCVMELNRVMHEEGLSQPKVARALGIQSQGHLSELLRGKYKHSRNSSALHWAREIRSFLSLTSKERQEAISIYGQAQVGKKRKSSKRTVWSKEQALMLENFFRQKSSPSKSERQLLASQCGVDVGVINTYFQNKRRRSRHL